MKCQEFDNLLLEWLSGRLTAELADRMTVHERQCARCARLVSEETDLRKQWSMWEPSERIPDLWPKVQARIDREPLVTRRQAGLPGWVPVSATRWATACAFVLILAVAVPLGHRTGSLPIRYPSSQQTSYVNVPTKSTIVQTATKSEPTSFDPSGQSDTSVDDPLEANMEHVWTRVNADMDTTSAR